MINDQCDNSDSNQQSNAWIKREIEELFSSEPQLLDDILFSNWWTRRIFDQKNNSVRNKPWLAQKNARGSDLYEINYSNLEKI